MTRQAAVVAGALIGLMWPAVASAQPPPRDPLALYVVDVRGAIAMLGQSEQTSASLGLSPSQLPGRGLGVSAGVHLYPIRRRGWAIGVGGEWLYSTASLDTALPDGTGARAIARRFESLSGQLSLNFGHRDGWSYLSGGVGPLAFDTWDEVNSPDGARAMTLNYGGGGRWFTRPHLAFTFDVRFYATRPSEATAVVGARDKQTVMVVSVGISVR